MDATCQPNQQQALMNQCSKHDTPPAISVVLTNRPGHDLDLELVAQLT